MHAKNGIWIIRGDTRKTAVCSSMFYRAETPDLIKRQIRDVFVVCHLSQLLSFNFYLTIFDF